MDSYLALNRQLTDNLRTSARFSQILPRYVPHRRLEEFLSDKDRGFFVLVGEPGIGKTGFMLSVCDSSTISYFVQRHTPQANMLSLLNCLAAEVHLRIDRVAQPPEWLDDQAEALGRVFTLLRPLSRKMAEPSRLVIVIDGLDELGREGLEMVSLFAMGLPEHVYGVCSSRPAGRLLDLIASQDTVTVFRWHLDETTTAEVEKYVSDLVPSSVARDEINAAAAGNILVAAQLVRSFEGGAPVSFPCAVEPGDLETFFKDLWYSVTGSTSRSHLCEDILIELAVATRPLSTTIIGLAMDEMHGGHIRGCDIEETLSNLRVVLESSVAGGTSQWQLFQPLLGHWLHKYNRAELSRAHRSMAKALHRLLGQPEHPDFDSAARHICRHLREWAATTLDRDEKAEAVRIAKVLVDDQQLRGAIERTSGSDTYADCILHEAVRCAERADSLPDVLRFGKRYSDHRRGIGGRVGSLITMTDAGTTSDAFDVAASLSTPEARRAALAIIACWAADTEQQEVLAAAISRVCREHGEGYGDFIPLAWCTIRQLCRVGNGDQLRTFLTTLSAEEYKDSFDHYARDALCQADGKPPNLQSLSHLLKKSARCDLVNLGDHVSYIADAGFDSGLEPIAVAESLRKFMFSQDDPESRLQVAERILHVFGNHGLPEYSLSALKVILEQLPQCMFLTLTDYVSAATSAARSLPDPIETIQILQGLLDALTAYDKSYDFFRAEAISTVVRAAEDLPAGSGAGDLIPQIRTASGSLVQALFQDYARVPLAAIAAKHGGCDRAVGHITRIEDPLCQLWAIAILVGRALSDSRRDLPKALDRVIRDAELEGPVCANTLLQLADLILGLAQRAVFAPVVPGAVGGPDTRTGYPRMAALALGDIAYLLTQLPAGVKWDGQRIGALLKDAAILFDRIKLKWRCYPRLALAHVLSWAVEVTSKQGLRRIVRATLALGERGELGDRVAVLRLVAAVLSQVKDARITAMYAKALTALAEQSKDVGTLTDVLDAAGSIISGDRLEAIVERAVQAMVESEHQRMSDDVPRMVLTAARLSEEQLTQKWMRQIRDVYSDVVVPENYREIHLAVADAYLHHGLWHKCREYAQARDYPNQVRRMTHLAARLDADGRRDEARELAVSALAQAEVLSWPDSRVRNALDLAHRRLRGPSRLLRELQQVGIKSVDSSLLIDLCRDAGVSADDHNEISAIESLLSQFVDSAKDEYEQIKRLAARARFLSRIGRTADTDKTIRDALGMLRSLANDVDGSAAFELTWAAFALSELIMESGHDQWLEIWLDAGLTILDRHNNPEMLGDIASAMTTEVAGEKTWLVTELLDVAPRCHRARHFTQPFCNLVRTIATAADETTAVGWFERIIASFSSMDLMGMSERARCLSEALVRAQVGEARVRLLGKLSAGVVDAPIDRGSPYGPEEAMREIASVVRTNEVFVDKVAALLTMVGAVPLDPDHAWVRTVVGEAMALIQEEERARSLFSEALASIRKMPTSPVRLMYESEAFLAMARGGLTEQAHSHLERLAHTTVHHGGTVHRNAAMGLALCGEPDKALTLIAQSNDHDVMVEVAGEVFCHTAESLMLESPAGTGPGDSWATGTNCAEATRRMTRCLRVMQNAKHSFARRQALETAARGVCHLPLEEAIAWLSQFPPFKEAHSSWYELCRYNRFQPAAVRQVLESVHAQEPRKALIEALSRSNKEAVSPRVRLILCAAAVRSADLFVDTVCDALERCEDESTLKEVERILDNEVGSQTAGAFLESDLVTGSERATRKMSGAAKPERTGAMEHAKVYIQRMVEGRRRKTGWASRRTISSTAQSKLKR